MSRTILGHIAEERAAIPAYKNARCIVCDDATPCKVLREVCDCSCHKKVVKETFGEDLLD